MSNELIKGHEAILWVAFLIDVRLRRCEIPPPTHERNLTTALRDRIHICEEAWAEACRGIPEARLRKLARTPLEALLCPGKVDTQLRGLWTRAGIRKLRDIFHKTTSRLVGRSDHQCWHCEEGVVAGVACEACRKHWHYGCAMRSLRDTKDIFKIVPLRAAFTDDITRIRCLMCRLGLQGRPNAREAPSQGRSDG